MKGTPDRNGRRAGSKGVLTKPGKMGKKAKKQGHKNYAKA